MKLWSIQHLHQLEEFKNTQILTCDETYMDEDFKSSYDWIITKMKHIDNPYKANYPIWAWKNWTPENAKPDLRSYSRMSEKGKDLIRIEFEVEDKNILVTDFDYWHSVLNFGYIFPTKESEDDWCDDDWDDPKYKFTDEQIIKSWDNIFNLGERKSGYNQACVWYIHMDQVINITHFKTR